MTGGGAERTERGDGQFPGHAEQGQLAQVVHHGLRLPRPIWPESEFRRFFVQPTRMYQYTTVAARDAT